jgi:hypothetical protein
MVSVNGVPLSPSETVQARPGTFFYIQRNCPYALDDRLATGILPQGKDTVFIAFRAEEDSSSIGTAESEASHKITAGVVGGLLWGSWGKAKTNGNGSSPILPVGFRLLSNNGWSFHAGFAKAGRKTSPPDDTGSEPQGQQHGRLLVRALVEKRLLLKPHPPGGGFALGPAFAAGVNALHLSHSKSKSWEYSAPFAGIGLEATWRGPGWQDHQFEVSLRPFLAAPVPPFQGSTKELSLVVGLSF